MKFKLLTLLIVVIMLMGSFSLIPNIPVAERTQYSPEEPNTVTPTDNEILNAVPETLQDELQGMLAQEYQDLSPGVDVNDDVGLVLQDNPNNYKVTYEPWKTKAAIHAIAYDHESGLLALGGGYLYDNEIHIYRYNLETGKFDKVWNSGDGIIKSDIFSLAWGDTDLNNFKEIIAASADGRVHVFEQRHIFDPFANTENMFDHVWSSPSTFRAFSVTVDDVDRDYRPDIVVGSWDGKVRCYEYDNHSGYPFSEEHWITYREVWNSGDIIDDKVYTVATGDTNNNGLPDIIAGTRNGRVYVFENDGITMMINGEPFPLVHDNAYRLVWTSENYTWTPILDMEAGELDGTPGEEIALVAQGQGVFILNWDPITENYRYSKVYRPWESWQSESPSPWRLDFWADSVVSANNVSYQFGNGTLYPEPITYRYIGGGVFYPDAECYPFNTGMANETDGYFTVFDSTVANVDNATAIVDFGKDEEGTGSANNNWDLDFVFKNSLTSAIRDHLNISISQSGTDFEQVNVSKFTWAGTHLYVDVDDALGRRQWDWFRYLKISVYGDVVYYIDSIRLAQVYTQIATALTVTIGPLYDTLSLGEIPTFGETISGNKLIIGTVMGTILAFRYSGGSYDLLWDSSRDDFFSVGTNIWDIIPVGGNAGLPIWLFWGIYSQFSPPTGKNYVHWTYGDIDPTDWVGTLNPMQIIMVDDANGINAYNVTGGSLEIDPDYTVLFDSITPDVDYNIASVEIALLDKDPNAVDWLPYAVVGFKSTLPESYDIPGYMRGDIKFYYRINSSSPYTNSRSIDLFDYTGRIVDALTTTRTGPYMDFVDWDGDGDKDMILSTGFIYYCENIGVPSDKSLTQFVLHPGYFAEINAREMNYYWGQPSAWDFDDDGDMDLVLSYDGRNGFTYWENTGTTEEPKWVENKRLFVNSDPEASFRINNMTDGRVLPMGYGLPNDAGDYLAELLGWDLVAGKDFVFAAYKPDTQYLFMFWPIYEYSNSYLVATYPTVERYDIAIFQHDAYKNYGYHVIKTWDTSDDLDSWTLTVRSGDVDADGKGELIVGDYDNNVYIFEHMVNNTYKRAFRSFDMNYTVVSDTSPYYWEELEGISGTFDRVIWNHADELLADIDADSDGLKELVIAAGAQLYVFEDTGIDDTYRLAYSIDFREAPFASLPNWDNETGITALAAANDLDYNGMNELLVAVGAYLFVYNVPQNAWSSADDYFMGETLEGRYFLVGNGAQEPYDVARIQALTTGDTDEDGYREIILGGMINTTQSRPDGFVKVYEWTGLLFEEVWNAPPEVTYWNPVTSILIDDQDYDSQQELIIGHAHGFDIWEWNTTFSNYAKVEVVTSSPNYPYITVKSSRLFAENGSMFTSRGQNDISYYSLTADYVISVFVNRSRTSPLPRLYFKLYNPQFDYWIPGGQLNPATYPGFTNYEVTSEHEPSLFFADNGTLYLVWRATLYLTGTYYYHFFMRKYDDTNGWSAVQYLTSASSRHYPKLVLLADGRLAVTYVASNRLYWQTAQFWSGPWTWQGAIEYKNYLDYYVYSHDVIELPTGDWALAMSARNTTIAKTDLDIYIVRGDSEFNFTDQPAYAATSSYSDEIFPDLGVLDSPENSLVVAYEVPDAPVEDRIQMSYSNTLTLWHQGEPLASIPSYITRVDKPDGSTVYLCQNSTPAPAPIFAPYAYSPSVLGRRGGGFMYSYVFFFVARNTYDTIYHGASLLDPSNPYSEIKFYTQYGDFVYGINPSSRFTHFNIRGVVDMAVGDTDGDNRKEVVVGFDNRAGSYELKHSNLANQEMQHEEVWLSDEFENEVTGVTVFDTNGNGFQEIGVSSERGTVLVFEIDNSVNKPLPLKLGAPLWNTTVGSYTTTWSGKPLVAFDVDNDLKDELFRGEMNGTIFAFDDDGSLMWANKDYDAAIFYMDVGYDSTSGYLLALSDFSGNFTVLNARTGELVLRKAFPGLFIPGYVALGDVSVEPGIELIATNTLDAISVWALNGSQLWTKVLSTQWSAMYISLGNFSGRPQFDIALSHTNGSITILNGDNGTVIQHYEGKFSYDVTRTAVLDYDGDGFDDLVVGRTWLYVLAGNSSEILYNSTNVLPNSIRYIYVNSFDDDEQPEALIVTQHAVYYEEFTSGRLVWSYEPPVSEIKYASFGNFTDGRLGLALALADGGLVALDALTGTPIWFALESVDSVVVETANVDNDVADELIAVTTDGQLLAYDGFTPGTSTFPSPIDSWNEYWRVDYDSNTTGTVQVWAQDFTNDGVDEILTAHGNMLFLYDTITPRTLWNFTAPSTISYLDIADFTGDGIPDVIAGTDDGTRDHIFAVDGASGQVISAINLTLPSIYSVSGLVAGDFLNSVAGTEFLAVWTDTTGNTGVGCYDSAGTLRFTTASNWTTPTVEIVTGNWDGDSDLDFAVLAGNFVRFYSGDCTFLGSYGPMSGAGVDIAVGEFNGDNYDDVVVSSDNGFVRTINGNTRTSFWYQNMNGTVDSVYAGQLNETSPEDEAAVNIRESGIFVFDGDNYATIWSLSIPTLEAHTMDFANVDGFGLNEVIVSLEEHVAIFELSSGDLYTTYSTTGTMTKVLVGNFDDTGTLDLVYSTSTSIVIVTNGTIVSGGVSPAEFPAHSSALGLTTALFIGILPLLFGTIVMVFRKKRGRF